MTPGDHVMTPQGPGTIAYQRMAPPDYATPEAFSVRLDSRAHDARYAGTIFAAADVQPLAFAVRIVCRECQHPTDMHTRAANGAYRCSSFGCGCELA